MTLDPAAVAKELHISLRRLQTIFSDSGMTVAGEIRRRRTRLARSILTNDYFDDLGMDEVAWRSGFNTAVSMRRGLAEMYGAAPREFRTLRSAAGGHFAQDANISRTE